jgi:hypothetical protein
LVATSNLQKRPYPLFIIIIIITLLLILDYKEPAAPTNASCKMDDLTDTVCVCVCVGGKGQETLFSWFFPSQSKANHGTTLVSLAKHIQALPALCI